MSSEDSNDQNPNGNSGGSDPLLSKAEKSRAEKLKGKDDGSVLNLSPSQIASTLGLSNSFASSLSRTSSNRLPGYFMGKKENGSQGSENFQGKIGKGGHDSNGSDGDF